MKKISLVALSVVLGLSGCSMTGDGFESACGNFSDYKQVALGALENTTYEYLLSDYSSNGGLLGEWQKAGSYIKVANLKSSSKTTQALQSSVSSLDSSNSQLKSSLQEVISAGKNLESGVREWLVNGSIVSLAAETKARDALQLKMAVAIRACKAGKS